MTTADIGAAPWCRVLVVEHNVLLWGSQLYVLRLAPVLERLGVEVVLAAPADSELGRQWEANGRRWVVLDTAQDRNLRTATGRMSIVRVLREPLRLLRGAWRTARLARQVGADVIDSNSHGWAYHEVALAGRLARRPSVVHIHGVGDKGPVRLIWAAGIAQATAAIAISQAAKDAYPPWASGKAAVVYNGVDTETFRPGPPDPDVRAAMTDDLDAPVIVVMARLIPQKGIDDVIEAVAALPPALSNTRLAIAGSAYDESYDAYLRDLGHRLLGNRVRFLGTRTDVDRVVRAADVLALASDQEGLSFCVMEAQASGKPAVAYPARGVAELIEHERTGLLARQGDVADLTAQLARVLADPQLAARLGAAAREQVLNRHTIESQAEGHAAVLRTLITRVPATA